MTRRSRQYTSWRKRLIKPIQMIDGHPLVRCDRIIFPSILVDKEKFAIYFLTDKNGVDLLGKDSHVNFKT